MRLWTTAETLPPADGRELCAILNAALRADEPSTVEHAAMMTHAINAHCVTRRKAGMLVRWPAANVTYRGGAMPVQHRAFFTAGTRYRAPMFVATSFEEDVAVNTFLMQLPPPTAHQAPPFQEPCLWRFHFDGGLPERRRGGRQRGRTRSWQRHERQRQGHSGRPHGHPGRQRTSTRRRGAQHRLNPLGVRRWARQRWLSKRLHQRPALERRRNREQ